jgi:uncharacterized membrane protein
MWLKIRILKFLIITFVFCFGLASFTSFAFSPNTLQAQEFESQTIDLDSTNIFPPDTHLLGRVEEVVTEGQEEIAGYDRQYQDLRVRILRGKQAGEVISFRHGSIFDLKDEKKVRVGDQVVLTKSVVAQEVEYFITDFYRLPTTTYIVIAFVLLIVFLTRMQGVTSLIGLIMSVGIITLFTVPQIAQSRPPELITLITAYSIAISSMLLAHGLKRRTYVAIAGTLITLTLAIIITSVLLIISRLSGIGSEEAYSLQLGPLKDLDFRGLLFGGIIIGTLGVLDDITTAQSATVEEIKRANPDLSPRELYRRGFSVGREHIASLVNTLFLAYAGAAMPLFLIFTLNSTEPLWMILNSEYITEEIMRTLIGSSALILAVPITTILAAIFTQPSESDACSHAHIH